MHPNSTPSPSIMDLPPFCSAIEVAKMLHISRATAYRMAALGEIPSMRLGKRVIFSREHLQAWLDKTMKGGTNHGTKGEG